MSSDNRCSEKMQSNAEFSQHQAWLAEQLGLSLWLPKQQLVNAPNNHSIAEPTSIATPTIARPNQKKPQTYAHEAALGAKQLNQRLTKAPLTPFDKIDVKKTNEEEVKAEAAKAGAISNGMATALKNKIEQRTQDKDTSPKIKGRNDKQVAGIALHHHKPSQDILLLSEWQPSVRTDPRLTRETEAILNKMTSAIGKLNGQPSPPTQVSRFLWPSNPSTKTSEPELRDALGGLIAGKSTASPTHLIILGETIGNLIKEIYSLSLKESKLAVSLDETPPYQLVSIGQKDQQPALKANNLTWVLFAKSTQALLSDRKHKAVLWEGIQAFSEKIKPSK